MWTHTKSSLGPPSRYFDSTKTRKKFADATNISIEMVEKLSKWSRIRDVDFEELKTLLRKIDLMNSERDSFKNGVRNISDDGHLQVFLCKRIKKLWTIDKESKRVYASGGCMAYGMRLLETRKKRTSTKVHKLTFRLGYYSSIDEARKAAIKLLKDCDLYGSYEFDVEHGYFKD